MADAKVKFVVDYTIDTGTLKEMKEKKVTHKKGKTLSCSEASAAHFVSRSVAEYVEK